MSGQVETEIKLAASPAMLERLRGLPQLSAAETSTTLVTTYFDTTDRRLHQAGISLRLRESGTERVQTVKLPGTRGSIVDRGEWTVAALGSVPKPVVFPASAAKALGAALQGETLEPVATTEVARVVRHVRHGGSRIEIAFDRGTIRSALYSAVVSEFELELVDGALADVLDLALLLPLGPDLAWSVASKSERCLLLADGILPAPVHSAPAALDRSMTSADGFARIAWGCLSHLLANVPLVVASGDPGALHQVRVAIRRLRAALGLFMPLFVDDMEADIHAAEFKAAADALGPARDTKVLLDLLEVAGAPLAADPAELLAHVRAQLSKQTRAAQATLAAAPFQRLLLTFARWIERGAWRKGETAQRPLSQVAARALRKRRRAVRRLGQSPAAMTADERHHLRIAIKKLRYAADFLAPLYAGSAQVKAQKRFAKRAAKVQDCLGELHDLDVQAAGHNVLFAGVEPIQAARLSAELAILIPTDSDDHHALLEQSTHALARMDEVKAWWKDDL